MTHKLKVGDRVTLSAVVTRVDEQYTSALVQFEDGRQLRVSYEDVAGVAPNTSFRDMAAIAVMAAQYLNYEGNKHGTNASYAFDAAEALDGELKNRDGWAGS